MGFNIQYGPIAAGVMLGARAGQGEFKQKQFQNDEQFMGTINDMQRTEDARRATDMQNALGYFDANSRNQLANAQLQQAGAFHGAELAQQGNQLRSENAYRAASLNANANYRGSMLDYRQGLLQDHQDNTDIRQQRLSDKEDQTQIRQDAIGQLTPEAQTLVNATGRLPSQAATRAPDPIRQLATQLNALKQAKSALEIPEVDNVLGQKTGKMIPRPGSQADYNRILGGIQQISQRMSQVQQPQVQAAPAGRMPNPNVQVNPQMQQQTAQAASGGMLSGGQGNAAGGQNQLAQETADFQQMYNTLPTGSTYMGPDGQLRMKRQ